MINWLRRHTEYKDQRETIVFVVLMFLTFAPPIIAFFVWFISLGILALWIVLAISIYIAIIIAVMRWIKRGK